MSVVFEERLGEIVDQLPEMDLFGNSYPVRYNWGTQDVLNKFLINNSKVYPLVWLIPPSVDESEDTATISSNCRIVIATLSDKKERFNPFIYKTDYDNLLNPIKNNLIKALAKSSISEINHRRVKREPNYSVSKNNKGATIAVWNAILIDIKIVFNDNCLKKIIF